MCQKVVETYNEESKNKKKNLKVFFENNYPCLLVQINSYLKITTEQSSLYNIAIAYFTAFINCQAYKMNIPIELVIRSSFGHNIPSVAETSTSFRINIGLVPKIYAEMLGKGIYEFGVKFSEFLTKKANMPIKCKAINEEIKNYNKHKKGKKVDEWKKTDTVLELLCKVGDSSGKKVSAQLMRSNQYVDLLANYIFEELWENSNADWVKPL